jgi:hypothetical protein
MTQIFHFGGIIKFKLDSDGVEPHAHQVKENHYPKSKKSIIFSVISWKG